MGELNNKRVLFVDDEKFILRSLKRLTKNEPYEAIFVNSGKEALELLEHEKIDLVISDIRMPEMDGYELLSEIKTKYPKMLRVALSGFTESRMIFNLLEKNIAKLYLFKPWDNMELKENIIRILEFEDILMNHELLELINNLDAIPSLPKLYQELMRMIRDEASIEDVTKLIEKDQAVSSKILKLANSAFYGRKTGDISQAIMAIGLNNLKNLVLTSSFFKGTSEELDALSRLWEHSVNTNKITLAIYEKLLNKKIPTLYGSAGLLHDIGKVILHLYYSGIYKKLTDGTNDEDTLIIRELDAFNITHQDIGAYLLNWWELPMAYVEAAMYHHRPSDKRIINKEIVGVIHLANYYSLKMMSNEEPHDYLDAMVFSHLEISRDDIEKLVEDMIKE